MGKYDCPLLVWLDIYVGPMLERRTLELKPHIHTLKVQNWLWDEKYMIVHYFISHGTVFFSHNKSPSVGLSAEETIGQTVRSGTHGKTRP
jgi:hypothetical protein